MVPQNAWPFAARPRGRTSLASQRRSATRNGATGPVGRRCGRRLAGWLAVLALLLPACDTGSGVGEELEDYEPTAEAPDPEAAQPEYPEPRPDFAFTDECAVPTADEIERDPVVRWAMKNRLWKSLVGQERGHARESGGWIYQCRTTAGDAGTRYFLDVELVDPSPGRNAHQVDLQDVEYAAHRPGTPDCRTVGNFHIHLSHAETARWPSGHPDHPSSSGGGDYGNAKRRGLPAWIVKPEEPGSGRTTDLVEYAELPEWGPYAYGGWNDAGEGRLSWRCDCATPGAAGSGAGSQDGAAPACGMGPGPGWTMSLGAPGATGRYRGPRACLASSGQRATLQLFSDPEGSAPFAFVWAELDGAPGPDSRDVGNGDFGIAIGDDPIRGFALSSLESLRAEYDAGDGVTTLYGRGGRPFPLPSPLQLEITSASEDFVEGRFTGEVFGRSRQGGGDYERGAVTVRFRARTVEPPGRCGGSTMLPGLR